MIRLRRQRPAAGFSLLELLVVVALIAGLAAVLLGGFRRGDRAADLHAGQAALSHLVALGRARAIATGADTRLLVNFEAQSGRFLRFAVLQGERGGAWETLVTATLPDGIYVVPGNTDLPAGLFAPEHTWTKPDGGDFRSALLTGDTTTATVDAELAETWIGFGFSSLGNLKRLGLGPPPAGDRDLIVATARLVPPPQRSAGGAPIQFDNPVAARGLRVSAYGLAVPLGGREGL